MQSKIVTDRVLALDGSWVDDVAENRGERRGLSGPLFLSTISRTPAREEREVAKARCQGPAARRGESAMGADQQPRVSLQLLANCRRLSCGSEFQSFLPARRDLLRLGRLRPAGRVRRPGACAVARGPRARRIPRDGPVLRTDRTGRGDQPPRYIRFQGKRRNAEGPRRPRRSATTVPERTGCSRAVEGDGQACPSCGR
jgi:hypothetical protein